MYFTLRYHYEFNKGDPSKSENGIGIIKSIYDQASHYWGERNQRDKGICARIEAQILQANSINVQKIRQKSKPIKRAVIDLSSIADMEDEDD
jgi:hypothetical protein